MLPAHISARIMCDPCRLSHWTQEGHINLVQGVRDSESVTILIDDISSDQFRKHDDFPDGRPSIEIAAQVGLSAAGGRRKLTLTVAKSYAC